MNKIYILSIVTILNLNASNISYTSPQGYTGFINIPTAKVQKYESIDLIYSNEVAISKLITQIQRKNYKADEYIVNIGILPYIEMGAKLSEIKTIHRDLSTNFKVQLPTDKFLPNYFPKFAFGMQDVGSGNALFKSEYFVMSGEYKALEYALGYGFGSKRMNGVFGGVAYHLNNYLSFLADYDTKSKSVGVRISSGDYFKDYKISLLAHRDLTIKKSYFAINFSMNFSNKIKKSKLNSKYNIFYKSYFSNLENLKNILTAIGYENIDLGERNKTIYIALENNIYVRNDLDAINDILKIASQFNYGKIDLTLKKSGVNIFHLSGDLNLYRNNIKNFRDKLIINYSYHEKNIYTIYNINSSQFKPKITLAPDLTSFIGTEVGVVDYQLRLKTSFNMNLYKGLDLSAIYLNPIARSDDLNPSHGRFSEYYKGSRLDSLMLNYTFSYNRFLNVTSIGSYNKDYRGIMNELSYRFGDNIIKHKIGYFKHKNYNKNRDSRKINILTYERYFSNYDATASVSYGKYWKGDLGFELKFTKNFGENSVYLFYQRTKATHNSRSNINQYIGIGVIIPFTPKKAYHNKYITINGTKNFNNRVRTTIKRADGSNKLEPGYVKNPLISHDIDDFYLNRGRLSKGYIKNNIR